MSDLDLSKAYEAGHKADWNVQDAAVIIDAALPHILDALAGQAEADKTAAAERFRTAPTATERVDASQWGDVCELAAVYLRARAEEARQA